MKTRNAALIALAAAALSLSCGQGRPPLQQLIRSLNQLPEYSIILEDMRIEGNFFREYSHRYKVVEGTRPDSSAGNLSFDSAEKPLLWADANNSANIKPLFVTFTGVQSSQSSRKEGSSGDLSFKTSTSDWERVSRREYDAYQPYLGMVIASKSQDGKAQQGTGYPPAYNYVGNPRYGQWRQDRSGNSFWEFAGKYAVMSAVFNMANRRVYRNDWNGYRDSYSSGRPYFGRSRQYGTQGSFTKQSNPTFFQRRVQRQQASQRRFSDRVRSRSRMSGTRSRSGRSGK